MVKSLLALGAAGSVAAKAEAKTARPAPVRVEDPRADYPDTGSTEDMYRREFAATQGERGEMGYAYHCVNCQGNCAWEVWTEDGKVTRENQSARYPQIAPDIPDANPRGCNKGVQHSQIMYEADRLLHPMRRDGPRGSGKWKRITWDEAIDEVATNLYETMLEAGPEGNYVHVGAGILTEARAASIKRLGTLLGAVRPYIASYVGDMFPGVSVVYGEGNIGCTFDFMYQADVNVFWGCNPNTSRIPDAHYIWEGKYNGAKTIVITPEFNSTAVHADLWVPVKPGYDGHLALSIVQRILSKRLYDAAFLKTFTDLPLLVREDGTLLRMSDVDRSDLDGELVDKLAPDQSKHHDVFFAFNKKTKKITPLPGCEGSDVASLRLTDLGWDIDPALNGRWTVKLRDGTRAKVTTVFTHFRKELDAFAPEKVAKVTGVHPDIVDQLATDLTEPECALITMGFSVGKHFNGMLSQRAISTLAAFTGRLGPRGGLNTENEWNITGLGGLSGFDGRFRQRFASGFVSEFVLGDQLNDYEAHYDEADVQRATGMSKDAYRKRVERLLDKSKNDEGFDQGKSYWTTLETFLIFADARFRRNKGSYKKAFLEKAKFLAYGDYRMSDFAMYADVLLPCASHYEVWDIRTNPGYHRYANIAYPPKGLQPVGESKSEWEIATLVVERMEAIAKERFAKTKDDRFLRVEDKTHTDDGFHRMDELVKEFTKDGVLRSDRDAVEYALEHVDQFKPNDTKSVYERGGFLQLGDSAGKSSPLYADKPYNTFERNLYLKDRFHTLTGRLTFYVDHPLWIELGAHVPTASEPMRPERHPFLLMTPHARWSIHSTYKTSPTLQRLQRGKPYAMVNPEVAKARGVRDGDDIRLFNKLGDAVVMAKLTPGVPKDAIVMEHGWEPFMFKKKRGHNQLAGDMLNLLELSDGWGHLKFGTHWDGNQHAYEATVDFERA
jgi:complex iron-sulfur molybdoenzyme family reductase subunit alpha